MRIAMYVDGWNMLGRMRAADIRDYGWCDFRVLAREVTGYKDAEVRVKFFTASDYRPERIADKQARWWDALKFMGCDVVPAGEFRRRGKKHAEKMTDVALASHLIADCVQLESAFGQPGEYRWKPGYDEAVLLTKDSDFIPAVRVVSEPPFRRPVYVLMPGSGTQAQEKARDFWARQFPTGTVVVRPLTKTDFAKALLPLYVKGPGDKVVQCHPEWMYREKYEHLFGRPGSEH